MANFSTVEPGFGCSSVSMRTSPTANQQQSTVWFRVQSISKSASVYVRVQHKKHSIKYNKRYTQYKKPEIYKTSGTWKNYNYATFV